MWIFGKVLCVLSSFANMSLKKRILHDCFTLIICLLKCGVHSVVVCSLLYFLFFSACVWEGGMICGFLV